MTFVEGRVNDTSRGGFLHRTALLTRRSLALLASTQRIKAEERWENRVILREDVEGVEKVLKSELVGAEELRARYEELLQAKAEMVG